MLMLGAETISVEVATLASLAGAAATAGVLRGIDWARGRKSAAGKDPDRRCDEHTGRLVKLEAEMTTELPLLRRHVENLEDKIESGIRGVHDRLDRMMMKK